MQELVKKNFSAGDVIISAGDAFNCAYHIVEGEVSVENSQGNVVLAQGQTFGEVALVLPDTKSDAVITAKTDVTCEIMDSETFRDQARALDPFVAGLFKVLVNKLKRQL